MLLLSGLGVRVHRIVLGDAFFFGTGEHRQYTHGQHLTGHGGTPIATQEVQTYVSIGINVNMLWTRSQKEYTGRFGRVVFGKYHL